MTRPSPTVTRVGLGIMRVVVVAGAAAGAIQGAHATAWSADLSTGAARSVADRTASPLTSITVLCPGPETRGPAGVSGGVPVKVAAASAPVATVQALLGRAPEAGTLRIGGIAGGGKAASNGTTRALVVTEAPLPDAVAVTGSGGLAAGVVATQEWRADGPGLRGLVSVPCGPAVDSAWIVAGGGNPGRQERLVLVNPGANVVTADIQMYGHAGPIASPNGADVVVPALGRATVLLDAISSAEKTPVVHVTTAGGLVYAAVNDTWTDGSVAAGSDDASPVAAPSSSLVIPAVAVDGPTTVRVAVPGTHDAVVQLRTLTTGGGSGLPSGGVATIKAQSVGEFDLSRLPAGTYAVQVISDEPVVAGALAIRRAGTAPGDFAWSGASAPISGVAGAAFVPSVPPGTVARVLTLVSTGDLTTAEVTVVDAAGTPAVRTLAVPADSTVSLALPTGSTAVWVRRTAGAGALRGAVVSRSGVGAAQLIATTPLAPAPLTTLSTRVLPLP